MPDRCVVLGCFNLANNVAKGILLHRISFFNDDSSKTQKKAMGRLGPGQLSERHQILPFQGGFSTKNYDHITKLIKTSKY